jgi:uncharacterized membrane protein YoaK (UPF0700 family)
VSVFKKPAFHQHSHLGLGFALWFMLAFIAGAVNAGGVMSCLHFVSNVTGYYTLFGVHYSQGNFLHTAKNLSVPFYFLIGSMISSLLVDNRVQRGLRPRYYVVMVLVSSILLLVAYGGSRDWFGEFGHELTLKRDYLMLSLLCLAMGMQNAVISSASGAVVRTSHMTGLTTDLGIGIVRALSISKTDQRREDEVRANWMRLGLILSFTIGGLVGAMIYIDYGYGGFYLPGGLAFAVIFLSMRTKTPEP